MTKRISFSLNIFILILTLAVSASTLRAAVQGPGGPVPPDPDPLVAFCANYGCVYFNATCKAQDAGECTTCSGLNGYCQP